MEQRIEAPNDDDVDYIARMIIYAGNIAEEVTNRNLTGDFGDLAILQQIIDENVIEKEAAQALQALGLAFGKVFVNENAGYDFWMVEDEYGRDPALRYRDTTLLVFPQTMISKRIEDGKSVDIEDMFHGLRDRLEQIREEVYDDA